MLDKPKKLLFGHYKNVIAGAYFDELNCGIKLPILAY